MVIHNFYIVVWYLLCTYFLLCICIKVFVDWVKTKMHRKNRMYIQEFFYLHPELIDKKAAKRILKYSKDDIIFDYICECYFGLKKSEEFKKINYEIDFLMRRIFKQKIQLLAKNDFMVKYLLLKNIHKSGFELKKFDDYIPEYMNKSKSKQTRSDSYKKKVITSFSEQKEFENAYFG